MKADWIEDLVVSKTMKMVMDYKVIEAIVSVLMDLQGRDNVNVPLYEQQLRETEPPLTPSSRASSRVLRRSAWKSWKTGATSWKRNLPARSWQSPRSVPSL